MLDLSVGLAVITISDDIGCVGKLRFFSNALLLFFSSVCCSTVFVGFRERVVTIVGAEQCSTVVLCSLVSAVRPVACIRYDTAPARLVRRPAVAYHSLSFITAPDSFRTKAVFRPRTICSDVVTAQVRSL